jgi:type VI secretion system lysozyme-like protein
MDDEGRIQGVPRALREPQQPPRVPLLDRLLRSGSGTVRFSVRDLRAALVRDIECLLNTRVAVCERLAALPCASASLLGFGLRDFSRSAWAGGEGLRALIRDIEQAIRAFEPRLVSETVHVEPDARPGDGLLLQLRIHAVLQLETVRERIALATAVDLQRGCIDVRGDAS